MATVITTVLMLSLHAASILIVRAFNLPEGIVLPKSMLKQDCFPLNPAKKPVSNVSKKERYHQITRQSLTRLPIQTSCSKKDLNKKTPLFKRGPIHFA
ncbi:MAG: hypothetical protein GY699_02660 [Desulfobacteraceae bacterium]|nr:hypothetical protein [Desulfobacteraceae bacterium]